MEREDLTLASGSFESGNRSWSHASEPQHGGNLRLEIVERVASTTLHELPCARVEAYRYAIVDDFVSGLHQQKIAIGTRDALDAQGRGYPIWLVGTGTCDQAGRETVDFIQVVYE